MKKVFQKSLFIILSMCAFHGFSQNDTIIEEIDAIGKGKKKH